MLSVSSQYDKLKKIKLYKIIAIIVFIIVIIVLIITILNKDISYQNKITTIGILVSLLGIILVNYQSTKNKETDIIIQKAEFTNKFVNDFRKLMPSLSWCSNLIEDIFERSKNVDFKEVYNHYENLGTYNFEIEDYLDVLRNNNLTVEKISDEFTKYFGKENKEAIFNFAFNHHKNFGHIRECYFDQCFSKHYEEKMELKAQLIRKKLRKVKNSKCTKVHDRESLKREGEIIKHMLDTLDIWFSGAIEQCEEDTYNDLECVALNTRFELLDYNKLMPLIYSSLHSYISVCYIRLMNTIAKGEETNETLYSNIKDLYLKISTIKKKDDEKVHKINIRSKEAKKRNKNNIGDTI